MNGVTGAGTVTVAGDQRAIVFDMDAADALYECVGPHWTIWLIERFVPRELPRTPGEPKTYYTPEMSPRDKVTALYALCAGDRRDRRYSETLEQLRAKIPPFELGELQPVITKAVLASFGASGEEVEVVAVAGDAPPINAREVMPGTGT